MLTRKLSLVAGLVAGFLTFASLPLLRADDKPADPSEEVLERAKVGTEDASVKAFLRKHSEHDDDLLQRQQLLKQLGSPDFTKREEAALKLVGLGLAAFPVLEQGLQSEDAEVVRR